VADASENARQTEEEMIFEPCPGFAPGEDDPVAYDYYAIRYLVGVCQDPMRLTLGHLKNRSYEFESMAVLDRDALDVELLYRQCIPAACIGVKPGFPVAAIARYLELFATCQTLILNHIDRHLDLSSSHTLRDPALLLADVHAVMCYAVAQLYSGSHDGTSTSNGAAALREMCGVSRIIIQSMYDNYDVRYRESLLAAPRLVLESYADPVRSRHLGSGFYASSIRGLYAYFATALPARLADIISEMRRLRQRVDELSDLFEDTVTGLITYPVARLLALPRFHDEAGNLLRCMWSRSKEVIGATGSHAGSASSALLQDPCLQEQHAVLVEMLEGSGVLAVCYAEASTVWSTARRLAEQYLSPVVADIVVVVLDLKRALLERMACSQWDDSIGHTFFDILNSVTGEIHE
jgi:hypothetical protein